VQNIKGHGNEADFPMFLHKSVRHWSLTLHLEPFRFWLRIRGYIPNRKTTLRLGESASRGVVFRLRISPRIRSQNRNGSKCSVRDLCRTDLCKNPRKSASLPCPFKRLLCNFNKNFGCRYLDSWRKFSRSWTNSRRIQSRSWRLWLALATWMVWNK
jgi:hypothetical protein